MSAAGLGTNRIQISNWKGNVFYKVQSSVWSVCVCICVCVSGLVYTVQFLVSPLSYSISI